MELNLTTIKDYAKSKKVSYEAVRKQIQKYKDHELKDHIIRKNKTQYLDEYAVDFLDNRRRESPVMVVQMEKDEQIEALENQIKKLLSEKSVLESKVTELSVWKAEQAELIAEAKYQKLLLEDKQKQIEDGAKEKELLEGFIRDAKDNINHLEQDKVELQKELREERTRPLTAWERLTGRKKER